jgi:hypothetical protein
MERKLIHEKVPKRGALDETSAGTKVQIYPRLLKRLSVSKGICITFWYTRQRISGVGNLVKSPKLIPSDWGLFDSNTLI